MKEAFLTIVTTVDGTENHFSTKAEMDVSPLSAVLCYKELNSKVEIRLRGKEVIIDRQGDYSMHLTLIEGEQTIGNIGIAGQNGSVEVITQRLTYAIRKNSLLMQIYYTLIFGEEKQNMRLRIHASQNFSEEI